MPSCVETCAMLLLLPLLGYFEFPRCLTLSLVVLLLLLLLMVYDWDGGMRRCVLLLQLGELCLAEISIAVPMAMSPVSARTFLQTCRI